MKTQHNVILVAITLILGITVATLAAIRYAPGEERQEFRDRNGQFLGTAVTRNGRTEYRDKNGWFQGSTTTTVNKPRR